MPYRWESNAGASGRYRDTSTGRFIAGKTVRRELDRYLETDDPAKALATSLKNREISLADWELGMRRMIKATHINAVSLERGGYANMRQSDWGRVGAIVREQYGYLKRFAGQIASGEQKLTGHFVQRATLYSAAGRNSLYRSKQANLRPGITHQRSIRTARDSCWQCIELHGRVFRIGDPSFPLPGRRVCNHQCKCHLEYLSLGDGDEYQVVESV